MRFRLGAGQGRGAARAGGPANRFRRASAAAACGMKYAAGGGGAAGAGRKAVIYSGPRRAAPRCLRGCRSYGG